MPCFLMFLTTLAWRDLTSEPYSEWKAAMARSCSCETTQRTSTSELLWQPLLMWRRKDQRRNKHQGHSHRKPDDPSPHESSAATPASSLLAASSA